MNSCYSLYSTPFHIMNYDRVDIVNTIIQLTSLYAEVDFDRKSVLKLCTQCTHISLIMFNSLCERLYQCI